MTQNKSWYVHIGDEIFGPVTTEVVTVMLRQTRLQFTDFIWAHGLTKWVRIIDVDDFTRLLPQYPSSPIPKKGDIIRPKDISVQEFETKTDKDETHDFSTEEAEELPPVPAKKGQTDKQGVRSGNLTGKAIKPGLKLSAFPRIQLSGKIHIKDHGHYRAIDISEGGVFVAAEESIEIGTEVDFTLDANVFEEKMSMTGVVIRHGDRHDEKGFAIEFLRLNPAFKRQIKDAIAKEAGKT